MKRIFSVFILAIFSEILFAQKNNVTTFLGIPVEGSKLEIKQKLIAKGYVPKKLGDNEFLEGEFNGTDVHIYIVTNNNKVFRIMVCDANPKNESDIKVRFNRLVNQFQNNKRYTALNEDYTLSDSEDISYEMTVNNKIYQALFYQVSEIEKLDTLAIQEQVRNKLLQKYAQEQLENPTKEINEEAQKIAINIGLGMIFNKPVWFQIREIYGEYYIVMCYDNENNKANGEDL